MTAAQEARGHLAKAEEYLAVADDCLRADRPSAAVSNAVLAGINAKDAICLALTGRTEKTENHATAEAELRRVGGPGAPLASTLGRLVRLKTKAQYQSGPASGTDAVHAVDWAARLCAAARQVVPGG